MRTKKKDEQRALLLAFMVWLAASGEELTSRLDHVASDAEFVDAFLATLPYDTTDPENWPNVGYFVRRERGLIGDPLEEPMLDSGYSNTSE